MGAIGNTVTATITPDSSGLVTAPILSCEVTNKDVASQSVSVIKTQAGSCSTECAAGWTLFNSNGKSSCVKNIGTHRLNTAAAACAAVGAHMPLPLNAQHDADMQVAFAALGVDVFALDLNDVNAENRWLRDDGTKVGYFSWNDANGNANIWTVCQIDICQQTPTCDLGVTITNGQGDSTLGFEFNSFKWSTSKVGGNDVAENQDLTCAISLAKSPPTVESIGCA